MHRASHFQACAMMEARSACWGFQFSCLRASVALRRAGLPSSHGAFTTAIFRPVIVSAMTIDSCTEKPLPFPWSSAWLDTTFIKYCKASKWSKHRSEMCTYSLMLVLSGVSKSRPNKLMWVNRPESACSTRGIKCVRALVAIAQLPLRVCPKHRAGASRPTSDHKPRHSLQPEPIKSSAYLGRRD
jgi:hypothetical protein